VVTEQDFAIKKVIRDESPTVILYNAITAQEVKVPMNEVSKMLALTTQRIKVVDGQAIKYGDKIKAFVKTKTEIGSVVSDDTKRIASVGEVKRKKQNRGRRGKRRR
tara:strand:- start:65 stop:382 length:318 start_codon:yes stop_codon:yes gene_type:complete